MFTLTGITIRFSNAGVTGLLLKLFRLWNDGFPTNFLLSNKYQYNYYYNLNLVRYRDIQNTS